MDKCLALKDEQTIRHQFDSLVKKALRGEVATYRKELARRAQREVLFSELSDRKLGTLGATDEYLSDCYAFRVLGYDVAVKHSLIGAALTALPEKNRDIILLAYFLDMTDTEIAKQMNLVNATIHYHRTRTLEHLQKLLAKEFGKDEQ